MINETRSAGSVGFQALWDVQQTGSICNATNFCMDTFVSTVHKRVSQRTPFRNVHQNRTLSQLLLLSSLAVIRKHSGYTQRITTITLSNNQTQGKIHPPKCRGKEIVRESSRITEGKRLNVQGHELVIFGLLYPLPNWRPNSVQSVSGQRSWMKSPNTILDISGMFGKWEQVTVSWAL